jgi:hypothetical protein
VDTVSRSAGEALAAFRKVARRDRELFAALPELLAAGKTLTILLGNHEIDLCLPDVRSARGCGASRDRASRGDRRASVHPRRVANSDVSDDLHFRANNADRIATECDRVLMLDETDAALAALAAREIPGYQVDQ